MQQPAHSTRRLRDTVVKRKTLGDLLAATLGPQTTGQHSESDSGVTVETRLDWAASAPSLLRRSGGSATSASLLQRLGPAVITGSVQFLAAMTTDNATLPMATAVAPNSHFQLRACGQTGINECRADVGFKIVLGSWSDLKAERHSLSLFSHASDRSGQRGWTHPWRFGPLFQVDAAAAGVSQHLLVHGLLCPSLLQVFFHQLGKLRVDGLCRGDKTKETSALLLCVQIQGSIICGENIHGDRQKCPASHLD